MNAHYGNVPVNQKYHCESCTYEPESLKTCDNCGLPIANIATICTVDTINPTYYTVGQDCCEKLLECNTSELWKMKELQKKANRIKAQVYRLRKAHKNNLLKVQDDEWIIYNENGEWSTRGYITMTAYKIYQKTLEVVEVK